MENEEYLDIKEGLSVGAVKYANPNEIITEAEYNYIKNKVPELDNRVGVIEEINSSLDNKTSFYNTDDDNVDKTTVKTKTTAPTVNNVNLAGKLLLGVNRRWVGYDLKDINGVYGKLGDGTKISNIFITDSNATEDHRYPDNFSNAKSIFCESKDTAFRWGKIEDSYIANMVNGLSLKNVSYATIDNNTIANSINGILVGDSDNYSKWNGSLNINNNHIRSNYVGLNAVGKVGTLYLNNNIFEVNRTHIKIDGANDVTINNAYLMDGAETSLDINNCKKLYINNSQISGGTHSFYASEHGTTVTDKTLPFYNDKYTISAKIKNSDVILKNTTLIGMNMTNNGTQFYSLFFDIDNNSTLTLDNVKDNYYLKNELPPAGYANLCFFPLVNYGFIKNEYSKTNYIINGTFKNTDINNTNKRSGVEITNFKNPWGGNIVRFPNGTTTFYYKVDKEMIGKEMALTFYCGESSNMNTRSLSGDIEIVQEKSTSVSGGRTTKNGVCFALRKSVIIVKPTKEFGIIKMFFNATGSPSFLDIACVFLGEYDTYNKIFSIVDKENYVNIGDTSQRPMGYFGQNYYDTTLGKNIIFDGTKWVDYNGITV